MKKIERQVLAVQISSGLNVVKGKVVLPGIANAMYQAVLVEQIIDSIRRVQFVTTVQSARLSEHCANPESNAFDPIKAAAYLFRDGNIDEAIWLVFLAIHFGKNKKTGWGLVSSVYGHLGEGVPWSWREVTSEFSKFDAWLTQNYHRFTGSYGNHRKYETLKPGSARSPSNVFRSYLDWIGPHFSHAVFLEESSAAADCDPQKLFDSFYRSMKSVISFGRMARFDFLTMIGKLGLVGIEPGKAYLSGATGPRSGANLLFGGAKRGKSTNSLLESKLAILYKELPLGGMGMQVLEDAICNWQKSPGKYILFRG